jgi:hypothetical protein
MASFSSLLLVSTGAFLFWTLSGYKGAFNDYMSRYHERDGRYYKNYFTGLAIIIFGIGIIGGIVS